ncbi:MAG: hypothetical protein KAV00_04860, partial [Phycisphaerae bacterium]|nr:hypothetical protein [Phycisphaerae bacterium]
PLKKRLPSALLKTRQQTPDDHQVDGHHTQENFTVDRIAAAVAQGRAKQPLEHAEVSLHLPTLTVFGNRPMSIKDATEEASRLMVALFRRAAATRRNDTDHAQLVIKELMVMFTVIADITKQCIKGLPTISLVSEAVELDIVRLGAAINYRSQE